MAAVICMLYCCPPCWRHKMKLLIYQSIYAPLLTWGHELWVVTERRRSWILATSDSYFNTYISVPCGLLISLNYYCVNNMHVIVFPFQNKLPVMLKHHSTPSCSLLIWLFSSYLDNTPLATYTKQFLVSSGSWMPKNLYNLSLCLSC